MIHMLKQYNHLKHNNEQLIKDTVGEMGTRSMAASKMTVSHLKNNNIITLFQKLNKKR